MIPFTCREIPSVPAHISEEPNIPVVRDCVPEICLTPLNGPVFLAFRAKGIKRENFFITHTPAFEYRKRWPTPHLKKSKALRMRRIMNPRHERQTSHQL